MKIAIIISFFLMSISSPIVFAQEVATPEPMPVVEEAIFNQKTNRPEIERLKVSYRGLIENYRNKEKQYEIAKIDFQQLNTLRSLEEALNATREVMVSRTDVLLTYMEIVKLELQDSEGIEIGKKSEAITAIEDQIMYLRSFREMAIAAQNRDQINDLKPEFSQHREAIEESGYYGLSLVLIGRLQAVHDKARIIESDIEILLAEEEVAPLVQAQRERAIIETKESLEEVNTILRQQLLSISPTAAKGGHNGIRDSLNVVYSKLALSTRYLQELLDL